jgi:hypothetical protein
MLHDLVVRVEELRALVVIDREYAVRNGAPEAAVVFTSDVASIADP